MCNVWFGEGDYCSRISAVKVAVRNKLSEIGTSDKPISKMTTQNVELTYHGMYRLMPYTLGYSQVYPLVPTSPEYYGIMMISEIFASQNHRLQCTA